MTASALLYSGIVALGTGLVLWLNPVARLFAISRRRALAVAGVGLLLAIGALLLPVSTFHASGPPSHLDRFVPMWQFGEFHTTRIAAPPQHVFNAIRRVRADEIALFHTLTWVRRGGQDLPDGVLDAGDREPLLDVAVKGGFIWLADDAPRELVVGTAVAAPAGARGPLTPEFFTRPLPPGYALAAMNFVVSPDQGESVVTTETRVAASDPGTARRFAVYWRVIYPGSALIRRMWLRAIEQRALAPQGQADGRATIGR